MASSFRNKYIDGTAGATDPLITLQVPAEQKRRLVWCSFFSAAFGAGDEAWLKFYLGNESVLELPMQIGITSTRNIWLCDNGDYRGNVQRVQIPFAMMWNSSNGFGYSSIAPMPLDLAFDRVTLTQTAGSSSIQALLAVLSQT